MAENISGAPFPRATRVIPATDSSRPIMSDILVNIGTKNASASNRVKLVE